jgi:4a-hydroxytetrahydrobiopterin dehydratase
MKALEDEELQQALSGLPTWHLGDGKIVRDYVFSDFLSALEFVNRVAKLAEEQNHHPDIDIRYNRVRLGLVTHDANGITRRDVRLASLIDQISG